jgi:type II secretory pathway component PulF
MLSNVGGEMRERTQKILWQILLFLSFAFLMADLLFLIYGLPIFSDVFEHYGAQLPEQTLFLIALGNLLRPIKIIAILVLVALYLFLPFNEKLINKFKYLILAIVALHLLVYLAFLIWGIYMPYFTIGKIILGVE